MAAVISLELPDSDQCHVVKVKMGNVEYRQGSMPTMSSY